MRWLPPKRSGLWRIRCSVLHWVPGRCRTTVWIPACSCRPQQGAYRDKGRWSSFLYWPKLVYRCHSVKEVLQTFCKLPSFYSPHKGHTNTRQLVHPIPPYKQKLRTAKPVVKTVKRWTEGSKLNLQVCFDCTDGCFWGCSYKSHGRLWLSR